MKTRRFLSILLVVAFSVSTWALDKDADGYYLIGSVQDWKDFAALVNNGTEPTAKARMVADINLGDDQTRIGDTREVEDGYFFEGVFDGQGHTLTIAYNVTDTQTTSDPQAPFTHIKGATIKNLHVDGTVATSHAHSAIVAWVRGGTNVISNVWSSLKTTTSRSGWDECSAIVSWIGHATVTIQDCLFTGSITGTNGTSYNGCFIGWCQHGDDNTLVLNCLSTGTFTNIGDCDPTRGRTHTNSYIKQFPTSIPADMQVTDDNLANGTTTAALNSNRTGDDAPWIQDPVTHQPMLKMFAPLKQDAEGYYLIGSVQDWDNFATLVETTPTVNAKMTADIDLGTDVTMVGTESIPYQGTFDGQGYTLTVNWSVNGGEDGVAPFRYVSGATIQKLHVDGIISATGSEQRGAASIVALSKGSTTTTINECWGSVSLTCYDTMGGLFSVAYETSTVNISDCLFSGTINPTHNGQGFCAGLASQAMKDGSNVPTINITRGLYLGKYTGSTENCYNFVRMDRLDLFGTHTITDCYYKDAYGTTQGTQVTSEELADGTATSKLQNNRTEKVWMQDGDQPMLAVFVANNSRITTGEAIQVTSHKSQVTSEEWYTIDGRKLRGKPTAKGIYIHNGKKMIVK
jgi:hypothetical protein